MQKKICLSIEQMQKLKDLDVNTKDASLCWVCDPEGNYNLSLYDESCYEMAFMNPMPAFTLQDILELLPIRIQYKMSRNYWRCCYWYGITCKDVKDGLIYSNESIVLLDTIFDMLVWLAEDGYLKKEARN